MIRLVEVEITGLLSLYIFLIISKKGSRAERRNEILGESLTGKNSVGFIEDVRVRASVKKTVIVEVNR